MPKYSCAKQTNHQSHQWAETEFATLAIKDSRRVRRLKIMAADLHAHPGASVPEASGTWSYSKAFYRLVENGKIGADDVLVSHRDALVKRIEAEDCPVVLVAQDTTTLNFGCRANTEGLGLVGNKSDTSRGLFVHGSLCVGAKNGEVFGLLGADTWAREVVKKQAAGARNRQPIEEKESHRWLDGWRKANNLYHQLGGQRRVISVADREGDIYEAFALCLKTKAETGGCADLLIRAQHNRLCKGNEEAEGSWQQVEKTGVATRLKIKVPRSAGKKERKTTLEIRYAQVDLAAPAHKTKYLGLDQPLKLFLVVAREIDPPEGVDPICWRLWTTVKIEGSRQAEEVIKWYARRWMIEEFHRILKTGCKVEERQFESLKKLQLVLSLDMIVACYLLGICKAAREHPDQALSVWLREDQWKALYCYLYKTTQPPQTPPNLKTVVNWIARLGGFLNRASDGDPGPQVLWRGLRRLRDVTEIYNIFNET